MSSEEFWNSHPQLFFIYLDNYNERLQREHKEKDYYCWLQGRYFLDAVNQSLQTKRTRIYPQKPYSQLEEEKHKNLSEKALAWINRVNSKILGG